MTLDYYTKTALANLTSSTINTKNALYYVNAALGVKGVTKAQSDLLTFARNSISAQKYQDAARSLWNVRGSVGTMPKIGAIAASVSASKATTAAKTIAVTPVVAKTPAKATSTGTVAVHDTLGRTVKVSAFLGDAMKSASVLYADKYVSWGVLPEEVANAVLSGAHVYINSKGLYEWVPVSASDKAHLASNNRTYNAARTTLVTGAARTQAWKDYWNSTSGQDDRGKASTGSGSTKIAAVKAGSTTNSNASAKTGTAQTAKAAIKTTPVKSTSTSSKTPTSSLTKTPVVATSVKSSTINSNASAKTNTAKTAKATIIPAKTTAKAVAKTNPTAIAASTTKPTIGDLAFGAAGRANANLGKILSTPATTASTKGTVAFKTADQVKADEKEATLQKNLKDFKKQYGDNKVTDIVAKAYYYTTDVQHLQKGLDVSDAAVASKLTFLPSSQSVAKYIQASNEKSAKTTDRLYNAVGKPKSAQSLVTGIKGVEKGVGEFVSEGYAEIRDKPVTTAGKVALVYATTAALGGALQAGKMAGSVGLVKAGNVLEDAGLPLVGLTTKYVGKGVPLAADVALTGTLLQQVGGQVASASAVGGTTGATKAVLGAGAEFVVGGAGFSKGSKLVGESKALRGVSQHYNPVRVTDISPRVTSAKISEIVGAGADTKPVDLKYGRSFAVGNKPIVTHVSGKGLKGFSKGAGAAPESALVGKTTQSFSKIENPFFAKTVKSVGGETESQYLTSAMNMAEKVYATRKPLYVAEKFEITSKAIPEAQRPAIVSAIKTYDGEIKVAGSVPMKSQSTPFTTREPHDLELYSNSVDATIGHVIKTLKNRGFKEGRDFRRAVNEKGEPTNQVEFKIKDELGRKDWDTGIEVFDHSTSSSYITKASKGKSEIAFGYNEKPAVLVGSKAEGFIKTQDLSEQVTRKVAGSTFLKETTLQPAHPNRVKDILDATTSSTAFAVKGNVPIERDIVTFVNSASKKFTPSEKDIELVELVKKKEFKPETDAEKKAVDLAKTKVNFQEKVANDPVFKFIRENQRLPTLKEAPTLNIEISDKVLLFEKAANKARKGNDNRLTERKNIDTLTTRRDDAFGREKSTSVGGLYSGRVRGAGEMIGYSNKQKSTSPKPAFVVRNTDTYSRNITNQKSEIPTAIYSRRSTSTNPTNIISTSQSRKNPIAANRSPSPTRNTASGWGDVISPSPSSSQKSPRISPSPSVTSKSSSPSPSVKSPSPKGKSPSPGITSPSPTISPSPGTKSPSPSPISSPSPNPGTISPSPTSPSPSPKRKKGKDGTIRDYRKEEKEKDEKDSRQSLRGAALFSSDKLVSKTKVAGFRDSIQSTNSTKRKITTSSFVTSKKSNVSRMVSRR